MFFKRLILILVLSSSFLVPAFVLAQTPAVLHNGDRVQASVRLNVRSQPSTGGTIIATVPTGTTGAINCGLTQSTCPALANGYTWRYIDWDGSLPAGWSADGDSKGKFIVESTPVTTTGNLSNPSISKNNPFPLAITPPPTTSTKTVSRQSDAAVGQADKTTVRPNIVVIMSDDQDYRMMYDVKRKDGSPLMPAVQSLIADKGVTFSNSYVAHGLCCPSRSTFLTGQYDHNHGVWANAPSDNAEEDGVPNGGYIALDHTNTLPVWLQNAGYFTAHIGKYLNGYGTQVPPETVPPGWSDWNGLVDRFTYMYYGYRFNENGRMRQYGTSAEDYQMDVISNKAVTFIQNHAKDTSPFFLSIAPMAIHSGLPSLLYPVPAPRYKDYFNGLRAPRLPNFNEGDIRDKPLSFQNKFSPMSFPIVQTVDTSYRERAETLMAVDDMVASVVSALTAAGKLDNTIIIYTSDNGYEHGEHRLPQQKDFIYEESLRVPLVVRGPGIPTGQINNRLVSNVDIAPTIIQLARATPQRVMDGSSLMPLMRGMAEPWRTALYIEGALYIYSNSNSLPVPLLGTYRGVRTNDYKYVEYNDTGEKEFYNFTSDACHKADPYELESQHANSCEKGTMSSLQQILKQFTECSGETCWYSSSLPNPSTSIESLNSSPSSVPPNRTFRLFRWRPYLSPSIKL